jgi:hypothetical protein
MADWPAIHAEMNAELEASADEFVAGLMAEADKMDAADDVDGEPGDE